MKCQLKVLSGFLLVLVLSCTNTISTAQAPNWATVHADYFVKYAPVDTPAWIFPICFKNALNQWDTIYLGYDTNATFGIDPNFGNVYETIDTSKFNASWNNGIYGDTALKCITSPIQLLEGNISFLNGHMPITMYWNNDLFYSESLPYPDLSPLPRAVGDLVCSDGDPNFNNCPINVGLTMSDSSAAGYITALFLRTDSIFFDGVFISEMGSITLNIEPFGWIMPAVEEIAIPYSIKLYPNPASSVLLIEPNYKIKYDISFYNLLGEMVLPTIIGSAGSISLDISQLKSGVYLLYIENEMNREVRKLIKH